MHTRRAVKTAAAIVMKLSGYINDCNGIMLLNLIGGSTMQWSAWRGLPYLRSVRTCKLHRTFLYLVSIHQMAHPQTEVADI